MHCIFAGSDHPHTGKYSLVHALFCFCSSVQSVTFIFPSEDDMGAVAALQPQPHASLKLMNPPVQCILMAVQFSWLFPTYTFSGLE